MGEPEGQARGPRPSGAHLHRGRRGRRPSSSWSPASTAGRWTLSRASGPVLWTRAPPGLRQRGDVAHRGRGRREKSSSGDIGNHDQPIIRDPQYIRDADYVLTESTYGDRLHEGKGEYKSSSPPSSKRPLGRGGNVIIPSFAVGRTQELLYFIREMKEEHLVRSVPNFTVCVDSPRPGGDENFLRQPHRLSG